MSSTIEVTSEMLRSAFAELGWVNEDAFGLTMTLEDGLTTIYRAMHAEAVKWRPIETAPKDRDTLGWAPKVQRRGILSWHEGANGPGWLFDGYVDTKQDGKWFVTHWMPLPEPPKVVVEE